MQQSILIQASKEELQAWVQEILDKNRPAQTDSVPSEIIDAVELKKRLGISEPTRIKYQRKGKLKPLDLPGLIRYDWQDVLKNLKK